ncbi:MAG: hypothetical protein WC455_23455 [Dehalococcoidia bacterium]|jgi:hypothetical protein
MEAKNCEECKGYHKSISAGRCKACIEDDRPWALFKQASRLRRFMWRIRRALSV